ncbi:type 1 glutamine amidotransferase [Sporolactobacillus pectinivorans]|uniref:type 1 glutamine amidotransferase n=1 Tax=Sporolactobacillus pectinivorans TaxID=1591408 RepID=UPI000C26535C|nr:gamma-glutamyl-gamma-aminobutyrate hydrolase family protein [Sporolactobacillus pectinivorans]
MHIHYFQHVPFEQPGMIRDWAKARHHQMDGTLFYEKGFRVPDIDRIDMLVIMGGPMNVYEEDKYPWLSEEKKLIKEALNLEIPILGICLGSQLLADRLGAKIFPGRQKEIGWFPVSFKADAHSPFRTFPDRLDVLHWHGDTFDLPDGAARMASTAACPNQAFIFENRVIGLQFHLEMAEDNIESVIRHSQSEFVDGPYIQKPENITGRAEKINVNRILLFQFLDEWMTSLPGVIR